METIVIAGAGNYGCWIILGMVLSVLVLIAELHSLTKLSKLTESSQEARIDVTTFNRPAATATKFAETPPSPLTR